MTNNCSGYNSMFSIGGTINNIDWGHTCSEKCNTDYIHKFEMISELYLDGKNSYDITYKHTIKTIIAQSCNSYLGSPDQLFVNPYVWNKIDKLLK